MADRPVGRRLVYDDAVRRCGRAAGADAKRVPRSRAVDARVPTVQALGGGQARARRDGRQHVRAGVARQHRADVRAEGVYVPGGVRAARS